MKTLLSFFRFYYYVIRRSPKRFSMMMNHSEFMATAMTPLVFFILYSFVIVPLAYSDAMVLSMFIFIPFVVLNALFSMATMRKGYDLQREYERQRREAERGQREYERRERERRAQEAYEQYMRDYFKRTWEHEKQRQQQRQTANNNMANAIKLLGSQEGFTEKDVKKAYRRLSKIHHPDAGGKEANFLKLKKAYDYIMNRI